MRYDGDVQVVHSLDGGAITFRSGQPDMEGGLSTAVYLSLWTEPGWWPIPLMPVEERIEEDSLEELEIEPLTNKVRQDYEERARKRLAWMVTQGVAKSVTVSASILSQIALGLDVTIEEPDGTTGNLRYRVNWQGQRAALAKVVALSPPPPPPPSTIISSVGLEAEYLFTGGSLLDTSGKARHLTTFTNLAFAAGPSGLDLSFVDRSVIRAASVPTINGSSWTQFSLAWECSAADAAAANRIFSFLFASTNGFEIYRSVGTYDMLIRFARSGGSEVVTVPNIFDATVREYALTFDLASKAWIVYRDGAAFLNNTLGNTPIMPNRVFVIGNYDTPSSANGHVGLIGKVRLWGNRVLTPAEALSLAQNPRQI